MSEHFVTIFDINFLSQGLALYESLRKHCPTAQLWVICVDEEVRKSLSALGCAGLTTVALQEIEDSRLLAARETRNVREYCWTLTAFSFDAVFTRCPSAGRVTYLDADLFFFDSPGRLFEELEQSGHSVLVTEHGFDPAYDKSDIVGRFCVQFLTMDDSSRAADVRHWWQEKVLDWCYDRREPGRFGDQKYLDEWPVLFADALHVLAHRELALAPWNVRMELARVGSSSLPVFYHFHSFRLLSARLARSVEGGYAIPQAARPLYQSYADAIGVSVARIENAGLSLRTMPLPRKPLNALRHLAKRFLGRADSFIRIGRST